MLIFSCYIPRLYGNIFWMKQFSRRSARKDKKGFSLYVTPHSNQRLSRSTFLYWKDCFCQVYLLLNELHRIFNPGSVMQRWDNIKFWINIKINIFPNKNFNINIDINSFPPKKSRSRSISRSIFFLMPISISRSISPKKQNQYQYRYQYFKVLILISKNQYFKSIYILLVSEHVFSSLII